MNKITKTFKIFSLAAMAAFFSVGNAFAQDAEISDEKLEAYVMVMDSVDALRAQLSQDISSMIKEHELMEGGRIFNEVKTAQGDTVKLAEQGITPEQIAAFNEIENTMAERTAALNSTFSEMVKEHIGVADYKKIKDAVSKDEEVKARYETLMAERQEEDAATEGLEGGEAVDQPSTGEAATGENATQK